MKHSEPPKSGYRANGVSKSVKYPAKGINQGPRASDAGGDTGFRQYNGHVKASKSKGKGMNKNAY